ncbi:PREDICTED: receptor-like protein 12 [Camelina sativa]|uniref:Receptor-like protein 12 n=1 Tax=Camelina sativa TaxID=90675 RepID=A0ABM0XQU8_CAMSA|nr:PREDICTED: receptor-like protein 12 [Camelina sativa]
MKGLWNSTSITHVTLSFIFFFVCYFEYVLAAPPTRQHFLCRPEQRDALLAFKNEFHIGKPNPSCMDLSVESHRKTKSWGNNSDCCSWEGITCNAKSGDVVELDLRCSFLHGRFHSNSSLQNLYSLTTLDLSYNQFSGQIPTSIGNLSNLIYLCLSGNNFSNRIPSFIGNLTQIVYLDLSFNQFSGQILYSIGNLSHLASLALWSNNLVGEIPSSFGNLNQLENLHVSSNKLSGNFPIVLLNLTWLSDLDISNNQFSGALPPNITSLSNLRDFQASDNAFSGTIPSSLFTIPSLIIINLNDNQLSGTLEFGNTSSSPSNLQELVIGSNNFKGPIPRSISKFVNLSDLDLSHFDTQGRPVDFSIFLHLKSLYYLDLSYLNTTTTIDLNDILSYSKSLSYLYFSGNHVSTTNKSSVSNPPSQKIESLHLSGYGITKFPELIRTQHEMRFLDISNNKIEGQVPGWLWTLPNLMYVNLSNNTFIGFQRSKMKQGLSSVRKPSMRYLLGSNNNFTGNIPSFICELRSLNTLDLSENNFNGSIPHCLGNLNITLSDLNLRQNNLSGGIPKEIFERLRSFDVGHNQLVGKLPRSLNRFSTLEVLNVESNRINDMFPFWLGSLQKLQVLVLRSNAFYGPIHQASFPQLRIIDVSRNHFAFAIRVLCEVECYVITWDRRRSVE